MQLQEIAPFIIYSFFHQLHVSFSAIQIIQHIKFACLLVCVGTVFMYYCDFVFSGYHKPISLLILIHTTTHQILFIYMNVKMDEDLRLSDKSFYSFFFSCNKCERGIWSRGLLYEKNQTISISYNYYCQYIRQFSPLCLGLVHCTCTVILLILHTYYTEYYTQKIYINILTILSLSLYIMKS